MSAQTTQHPPSIPRASKQKWKLTSDLPAQKADNQCNLLHQATYNYNKHDDPETQPVKRLRQLPIFILVALLASITFSTSTLAANRDEVIFFFNDALGSAVAAVNESGELCWSEQYTGYGDKTINDDLFNVTGCGIVGEERGFTGYTEDVNSDLVYMQQRYYDPSIGRFLSIDPVAINPEEPTTYNRYAYANNNPYKYTDPNGEFAILLPALPAIGKGLVALGTWAFSANGAAIVGTAAVAGYAGNKLILEPMLNENSTEDGNTNEDASDTDDSDKEQTPLTNGDLFGSVRGSKAKVNKSTGEIWERDMLHKDHYEVYKNRKNHDNGKRDRSVWDDGRQKDNFK